MPARALHRTLPICELLEQKMTDPTFRKGERTKFKLMKSVAELLNEYPFKDIRNLDICEHAGVSAGVMNAHYQDKRALMVALLTFAMEQLAAEFDRHNAELGEEPDRYIRLFDTIHYFMSCAHTNRGLWRLLLKEYEEHPGLAQLHHEAIDHWSDYLAQQIPDHQGNRKRSQADKKNLAVLLGGMLDDAMRRYLFSESPIADEPIDELIEKIATLRYSAIFGEYPKPASVKKALQMSDKRV